MANLFAKFSSFFHILKRKPIPERGQATPTFEKANQAEPLINEARIRALSDAQLKEFISQQREQTLTRILHSITDQSLQLRIVQCISDESALKRVSRSQLSKKVIRVAERVLRERFSPPPQMDELKTEEPPKTSKPAAAATPSPVTVPLAPAPKPQILVRQRAVLEETPLRQEPAKVQDEHREQMEQKEQKLKKEQADRQARLAMIEILLKRAQELKERLAHRQTGAELAKLRSEVAALRRWRREFPTQFDETETLLKELSNKRTEVTEEAKWNTWARTELATRIQEKLEKLIGELEAEADPFIVLKNSVGLTPQLQEYAKEMKALGSLDRSKDQEIWEKFKSLSDRGWAICDRMKLLVFESFTTLLAAHISKPLEFTVEALTLLTEPVHFNPSAYASDVPAQIKELRFMWLELGAQSSKQYQDREIVFAKLFEMYSRQMNLQLGRAQRAEQSASQLKRDLLNEMKIACEGASTLASRVSVAKRIEEKWLKAPTPDAIAAELKSEFEQYQARIREQITAEAKKVSSLLVAIQTQAQEVLDKILAKSGISLSQALKTISGFEAEILALEKQLGQFKGLLPEAESTDFQRLRGQAWALLQEGKAAASREANERAEERIRTLLEAEELALSTDWERSHGRMEELRANWKKTGTLGQSQDAMFGMLFENVCMFYLTRYESRARVNVSPQQSHSLKIRKDLVYSLEALARLRKAPQRPLPFPEEELRAQAPGKLLELGIKYNHILSLDPAAGTIKETKKIMEQWLKTGVADDESLSDYWRFYLDRVHTLLDIR